MAEDDDDDLRLTRTSASLLADLETSLPRICWKRQKDAESGRKAHRYVKRKDLDYVLGLIEPFQEDPQLLDSKLKTFLPDIVTAYLDYILQPVARCYDQRVDAESALLTILYYFCKVRGRKIIIGFFNNEPRYLEPILARLEVCMAENDTNAAKWQVSYMLLLWLSHLLLVPFDLATISTATTSDFKQLELTADLKLSAVVDRALVIGLHYVSAVSRAQDAAALVLTKLVIRPDLVKLGLAERLVASRLQTLSHTFELDSNDSREILGSLRFLANTASSADLIYLMPKIYETIMKLTDHATTASAGKNAVASKLLIKALRNLCVLCLRESKKGGELPDTLDPTVVLESSIGIFLDNLSAQDSPVRFSAAKAISIVVSELDEKLGHEIIQAVLDMFKEDSLSHAGGIDFRAVNPLKWHGLTLTLAHTLFKRNTSPAQIPETLSALIPALNFEQRSATGSVIGTNVRDAANFGLWSLSRRYTTTELKSVPMEYFKERGYAKYCENIIQILAVELILSACLDPAGNIRRGSSAALQELVGRHPDEVFNGIALIQVVDYQAVGLRSRAMTEVGCSAAILHKAYHSALLDEAFGWRGLRSNDTASRMSAALLIANLDDQIEQLTGKSTLRKTLNLLRTCGAADVEVIHGLTATLAKLLPSRSSAPNPEFIQQQAVSNESDGSQAMHVPAVSILSSLQDILGRLKKLLIRPSLRTIQAELPATTAQLLQSIAQSLASSPDEEAKATHPLWEELDNLTHLILERSEDTVLQEIPALVHALQAAYPNSTSGPQSINREYLRGKIKQDNHKNSLQGAGFAIALAALAADDVYHNPTAVKSTIEAISDMVANPHLERRILALKTVQTLLTDLSHGTELDLTTLNSVCQAILIGTRDFTITERGDVGSTLRLQAIACSHELFRVDVKVESGSLKRVKAAILRLSLEKLDRVRFSAAQCRSSHLDLATDVADIAQVSSEEYFESCLQPLLDLPADDDTVAELLEGCVSCAGVGNEALVRASRSALVNILLQVDSHRLSALLSKFMDVMRSLLEANRSLQAALELLAFLLEFGLSTQVESDFKWRNLLLVVQKSHFKSAEIPRILAAVRVYHCLTEIPQIRSETLKKLLSMLRTNPYPRVRLAIVETLYMIDGDEELKLYDWKQSGSKMQSSIEQLEARYLVK